MAQTYRFRQISLFSMLLGCLVTGLALTKNGSPAETDWRDYLGGPDRNHYSGLTQIDSNNVGRLRLAWQYNTSDSGQMQCNALIVNGMLFGMTASAQAFAVDAATGRERWRWRAAGSVQYNNSRGVAYWEGRGNGSNPDGRILFTNGSWLYAVEARTGQTIQSFGDSGRVSLRAGLGTVSQNRFVVTNTPGTIFNDLIIMPIRTSDGTDPAQGHIQAFNVRTGKLAWVFHTIPRPGEVGYNTWPPDAWQNPDIGSANNWAGMALDPKRGIVYVPTGSAAADYYGGNRKGENLFANCLLALDARTGKRLWHFQFVHHDILDRDAPAPPNLITVMHHGKQVDAVAQITKQGLIFVFDRVTGKPLFPIIEKPVPASDVPGEQAWKTQPFPSKPAPFARQSLTEADLSPYAENGEKLRQTLRDYRYEGPFTPYSNRGTIVFPGFDGGAEWGGAAVDPDGVMYLNSNEMAWLVKLDKLEQDTKLAHLSAGQRVYNANCVACHGSDRRGNPGSGYPSLLDLSNRYQPEYVKRVIVNGKNMMPAFPQLTEKDREALLTFLLNRPETDKPTEPGLATKPTRTSTVPYRVAQFTKFLDSKGRPAIRPPCGTLNAIDLNTGEYRWKIPFGTYPELEKQGGEPTGAESYGGPLVTASGLLFIAGTKDRLFRAYDKRTGRLLWQTELPFASFATPSTYAVNGRQYIVVACGGAKLGAPKGDSYVAFALD